MDPIQWLMQMMSGMGGGGMPGAEPPLTPPGGMGGAQLPQPGMGAQLPMMQPPTAAPAPTMPMSQILSPFGAGQGRPMGGMGAMNASMPAPAPAMPPAGGGGPTNIVPPGLGAAGGAAGAMDPAKMAALQALVEPEQEQPLSPPGAPSRPQIDPGMLFEALMKMGISPAQIPQLSSILRRQ